MLHEYDATKEKCPLPLVKMRLILKNMQKGDTFMIRISDKGSKKDIPKFLTISGYSYIKRIIDSSTVELFIENR